MMSFMGLKGFQLLVGWRAMGQSWPAWQGQGDHLEADGEPSRRDGMRGRSAFILLGLMVFGFALRAATIAREPLWSDESLTAILVRYPWWSFPFTSVDATPPLFYWLEKALVPEGAG